MPDIFISYARQDVHFTRHVASLLEGKNFDVWIDESRLVPGNPWWEQIEQNIDRCFVFMIVMSSASEKSEWVQRELSYAERRGKRIFPLLIEGEVWQQLASIQCEDMRQGQPNKLSERLYAELQDIVSGETAWRHLSQTFLTGDNIDVEEIVNCGHRISRYFTTVSEEKQKFFIERLEHASDQELIGVICAIHTALVNNRDDVAELICNLLNYLPNQVERLKALGRARAIPTECLEALFQAIELETQEFKNGFRSEILELYGLTETDLP
jgi:hypothetical protein